MGNRSRFGRLPQGNNAAIGSERKKPVAARRAAIRGRAKKTKHPGKRAHAVLAGNALQIHVPAHLAMHVPDVTERSGPGVKAGIAYLAAPGAHPGHANEVILHAAPTGTAGTIAMADRAEQEAFTPECLYLRIRTVFAGGKTRTRFVPQVALKRKEAIEREHESPRLAQSALARKLARPQIVDNSAHLGDNLT